MFLKALFFSTVLFCSLSVEAAVRTWDGGGTDGNWTTAANWSTDVAPVAGDDLVFPATAAQFATNNNFFALTTFGSLTFEGGAYTVSGNPFRLTGGMNVTGGSPTINAALFLNNAQTLSGAAGAVSTIAILSLNVAGVTIDGAGTYAVGIISGPGSVTKNGPGAAGILASASFTGAINLNEGVFIFDASAGNSTVTVNSPATGGGILGFSGFGGTGTVGTVNLVQGTISAGTLTSPTGILNTGTLNFTADGNYACKIGGPLPGANGHDQLNVVGAVNLNGARLAPIPWGTYRPAIGDAFTIIRNDGADPVSGTFLNAPEGAVFGGALNTAFRITYVGGDGNDVVITRVNRAPFDFDGDGRSEVASFRPSNGTWNATLTGDGATFLTQFGAPGDNLTPADFDGDNRTDVAIFRNGVWWILNSSNNSVSATQFGLTGDVPIPNDFDGDGRADLAVFRPTDGVWYQLRSLGNQFFAQQFGISGDKPLMGDFDGDGIGDIAVYRPADGVWHQWLSSTNSYTAFPFGIATDRPCAADYDGDGKTDACVFRGTTDGSQPDFYIINSSNQSASYVSWGIPDDLPMLGDYDGDGKVDIGIFRAASQQWYWIRSSNATVGFSSFGQPGDLSVPSAYVP